MSLYADMATQTLYKRTRVDGDPDAEYEGDSSLYNPPIEDDPTPFACVYEPSYFDRGRDFAATGNGRVLTETEFAAGDLVVIQLDPEVTQEVTRVDEKFDFDGSFYGYEVYL